MKVLSVIPMFFMCSGLMLVQPVSAAVNPKDTKDTLQKRVEILEKEIEDQKQKQKQATYVRKISAFEEESNQTIRLPRFEPYSYP